MTSIKKMGTPLVLLDLYDSLRYQSRPYLRLDKMLQSGSRQSLSYLLVQNTQMIRHCQCLGLGTFLLGLLKKYSLELLLGLLYRIPFTLPLPYGTLMVYHWLSEYTEQPTP